MSPSLLHSKCFFFNISIPFSPAHYFHRSVCVSALQWDFYFRFLRLQGAHYGPNGPRMESRSGLNFSYRADRRRGLTSLLYNVYCVFLGLRRPGGSINPSPLLAPRFLKRLSCAYIRLPSGPAFTCHGVALNFILKRRSVRLNNMSFNCIFLHICVPKYVKQKTK